MHRIKIPYFILAILALLFGVFMFVYGEMDDSPGGQLLGVLAVLVGVTGIIKSKMTSE